MAIKYQIFVSSTFDDLRDEREQVLKATLEMGHIPVGMEMFSAADEEQWKIITRQIDECDYYAVIVAHRYGSIVDGVSYTEKEYDYAVSQGMPVLGFVIEHDAPWPADRIEEDVEKKASLEEFKAKVKQKPVGLWKTAADLYGMFSIALVKQIVSTPRPGWTRADEVARPDVVNELSRLSGENADLRKQLTEALHKAVDDAAAERRRIMQTLRKNYGKISYWYDDGDDWEDPKEVTLNELFFLLAPEMLIEKDTEAIGVYVGHMLNKDNPRQLRSSFPVPTNSVNDWLADFVALDLFEPSPKRHPVSDTKMYWSLTEMGRETYSEIRRTLLERVEPADDKSGSDSLASGSAGVPLAAGP